MRTCRAAPAAFAPISTMRSRNADPRNAAGENVRQRVASGTRPAARGSRRAARICAIGRHDDACRARRRGRARAPTSFQRTSRKSCASAHRHRRIELDVVGERRIVVARRTVDVERDQHVTERRALGERGQRRDDPGRGERQRTIVTAARQPRVGRAARASATGAASAVAPNSNVNGSTTLPAVGDRLRERDVVALACGRRRIGVQDVDADRLRTRAVQARRRAAPAPVAVAATGRARRSSDRRSSRPPPRDRARASREPESAHRAQRARGVAATARRARSTCTQANADITANANAHSLEVAQTLRAS